MLAESSSRCATSSGARCRPKSRARSSSPLRTPWSTRSSRAPSRCTDQRRRRRFEPTEGGIMITPNRLDALRQSRLAAELSGEQCSVLSDLVNLRELKDGELLVKEGEPDNHL